MFYIEEFHPKMSYIHYCKFGYLQLKLVKYEENNNKILVISGVDPFFGLGGAKVRKIPIFFGALCALRAKSQYQTLARGARRKNENCVCLMVFLC